MDRRRGGQTILTLLFSGRPKLHTILAFLSEIGLKGGLPILLQELKTGTTVKGLLHCHLWCPNDYAKLMTGIEQKTE